MAWEGNIGKHAPRRCAWSGSGLSSSLRASCPHSPWTATWAVSTPQWWESAYYRTSTGKIVAMVIAVIYIVSPIDLIPDVFLPIGIVDDATALTWLLFAFGQEYTRRSRAARENR